MEQQKKKPIAPPRLAALLTGISLGACGAGCVLLYTMTAYLPLLLAGIMQALPALINLLLLIPMGKKREEPKPPAAPPAAAAADIAPGDVGTAEGTRKKRHRIRHAVKHLPRRMGQGMHRLWRDSRSHILVLSILGLTVGANVFFWFMAKGSTSSFALGYHIPVILVAMFVLFIVLDKWCKHAGDDHRENLTEDRTEHGEDVRTDLYHQAVLHGLRGALAAGKAAQLILSVALMIKLLGYTDLVKVAVVLVSLLFAYETVFLLISLGVRVIRHELSTAPELSIPMPGLGGEDLGVLSYLEKNTGITMRSLWSIRLVKQILPYAAMAVVLLLWGFSGVVKIEAYQEGAHYRLGCLQEETLKPGLHMTLPWPFDTVEVYDTRVVNDLTIGYLSDERADNIWTETTGTEEYKLLLGGGKELVSINLRVEYRIDDLHTYLTGSSSPEALLQAAAYETVTARTIGTDLNTLLAVDRAAFAQSFKEELIERTEVHHTGLTVVSVVLESIHPPVEVAAIYQELISAEIQAAQIVLEAQGTADVTISDANNYYYTQISEAEVDQYESLAAARAAVAEFMASVEADNAYRDAYRYYKYLQAITEAYADAKIVIVGDGVNTENIYIGNIPLG
ncbi:MAG: hypothetical protein IJX39_03330 [Clostridia bacterium]|nr:hypothetical protein [Clostridia bacterium]